MTRASITWLRVVGPVCSIFDPGRRRGDAVLDDLEKQLQPAIDAGDIDTINMLIDCHDLVVMVRRVAAEIASWQ